MHRVLLCLAFVTQLVGLSPAGPPVTLKIHLVGFGEYEPAKSLAEYQQHLQRRYRVECSASLGGNGRKLDNLEPLRSADVLVLFARRMSLPEEQMAIFRQHWEKGKAIVGLRTASHAFQKTDNEVFDRKVLGGNYGVGPSSNGGFVTAVAPAAENHPVLKGVGSIKAHKYAYGNGPLAESVVVLHVVGRIKEKLFPVTWVNTYQGGRVFYTSMGAPEDFAQEDFSRLLDNAIFWTAGRDRETMRK